MGSSEQSRREMKEMGATEEAVEEEEEEEEQREPMNIILFYADDWRHDVSFVFAKITCLLMGVET